MNEGDTIKKALNISRDNTSEYMSELLMDPEWSTYKMFENLASLCTKISKSWFVLLLFVEFQISALTSFETAWTMLLLFTRMKVEKVN